MQSTEETLMSPADQAAVNAIQARSLRRVAIHAGLVRLLSEWMRTLDPDMPVSDQMDQYARLQRIADLALAMVEPWNVTKAEIAAEIAFDDQVKATERDALAVYGPDHRDRLVAEYVVQRFSGLIRLLKPTIGAIHQYTDTLAKVGR